MSPIRATLLPLAMAALAGCASVPSTQPMGDGTYLRVTESGIVVYQIQANSPQRCQRYAQGIRAEIRSKNFDGAAVCTSVDDQDFRYQSSLLDEWDGSTFVISAKTEMMCEYLAGELAKAKAPSTDRQRITQTSPCKLR